MSEPVSDAVTIISSCPVVADCGRFHISVHDCGDHHLFSVRVWDDEKKCPGPPLVALTDVAARKMIDKLNETLGAAK